MKSWIMALSGNPKKVTLKLGLIRGSFRKRKCRNKYLTSPKNTTIWIVFRIMKEICYRKEAMRVLDSFWLTETRRVPRTWGRRWPAAQRELALTRLPSLTWEGGATLRGQRMRIKAFLLTEQSTLKLKFPNAESLQVKTFLRGETIQFTKNRLLLQCSEKRTNLILELTSAREEILSKSNQIHRAGIISVEKKSLL